MVDCVICRCVSMVWVCVLVYQWPTGEVCWVCGCSANSYYSNLSQGKLLELRKR